MALEEHACKSRLIKSEHGKYVVQECVAPTTFLSKIVLSNATPGEGI